MDDLEKGLLRYLGRDQYLRDLRSFVRYGGKLSPTQRAKALRHLAGKDATPAVVEARS